MNTNQNPIADALATIRSECLAHPDYAWGWHCNITMAAYDSGATHEQGTKTAERFMRNLLDLHCTDHETVVNDRTPTTP